MMKYVISKSDAPVSGGPAPERAAGRGARAVVGGVDYVVGGWGEYEINRRRARWDAAKKGSGQGSGGEHADETAAARYPGRTYVGAHDAARSILAGARGRAGAGACLGGDDASRSALQRAALRLSTALGRLEDRLCDPDDDGVWECASAKGAREEKQGARTQTLTVPALTSADLRDFADDSAQAADPDAIYDLAEDVVSLVAATGSALPLLPGLASRDSPPPLPSRVVPVTDEEGVLRLEAATAPYVTSLETLQAALATHLDKAAVALETSLGKK